MQRKKKKTNAISPLNRHTFSLSLSLSKKKGVPVQGSQARLDGSQ